MIHDSDFSIENFKQKISHIDGKILSIDFGTKKIGLAITNIDRSIAFPFEIYQRKNLDYDIQYFLNLIDKHKIAGMIIGVALIDDKFLGNKKLFSLINQ
jgi:putative Holliday junction resolvase